MEAWCGFGLVPTTSLEDLARALRSIGEGECDDLIVARTFDLAGRSDNIHLGYDRTRNAHCRE